jgi:hypothetical protein
MTKPQDKGSSDQKAQPWKKWYAPKNEPEPAPVTTIGTYDGEQNGKGPIGVPATEFDV